MIARLEITGREATRAEIAQPLLYSVADAAKLLGIGRSTCWSLIAAGEIEIVRVCRRTLVKSSSVQKIAQQGTSPRGEKTRRKGGAKDLDRNEQ